MLKKKFIILILLLLNKIYSSEAQQRPSGRPELNFGAASQEREEKIKLSLCTGFGNGLYWRTIKATYRNFEYEKKTFLKIISDRNSYKENTNCNDLRILNKLKCAVLCIENELDPSLLSEITVISTLIE